MDLFDRYRQEEINRSRPLADRMKPERLEDFYGQSDICGKGALLPKLIDSDKLTSVIFYGPPGSGKTSLARIIAKHTKSDFISINAVTSGIKDIRDAVQKASDNLLLSKKTILFIDEIHRFNKLQQDALLPDVENGSIILIGSTTENPFYEVNNALISRSTVFRLKSLGNKDIINILKRSIVSENGLGSLAINISDDVLEYIAMLSGGDARRALNVLELATLYKDDVFGDMVITREDVSAITQRTAVNYDKNGSNHYDLASAFIKSIRGSDPDAALHYMAVMLDAGEDPRFIARRLLISASEDIGNADPMGLILATSGAKAVEIVGMPEARIILAQMTTYLASAPKSNASYLAIDKALYDVKNVQTSGMPAYLRDLKAMHLDKNLTENMHDMSAEYIYPHDYVGGYVAQQYLPDELKDARYYIPKDIGKEKEISKYLNKTKFRRNDETNE